MHGASSESSRSQLFGLDRLRVTGPALGLTLFGGFAAAAFGNVILAAVLAAVALALFAFAVWIYQREQAQTGLLRTQIASAGRFDPLTGLPNRVALLDGLSQRLETLDETDSLILIVVNVDSFAQLNDSLGPDLADQLLEAVALRLRGMVPRGDLLARLDGDEFAVASPGHYAGMRSEAIAERLMACFADQFAIGGQTLAVSASIGWVEAHPGDDAAETLRSARWAMREAKRAGKNRVRSVDDTFEHETRELVELEADLRGAIASGAIGVVFQPIVRGDGSIFAYEALARWDRPDGQSVSPETFFAVAERIGLSSRLGEQILRLACKRLAKWQEEFGLDDVSVAVNFSAEELIADDFVVRVADALTEANLEPHKLIVEIGDSISVRQFDKVCSTLEALRRLGTHVALDDFGSGFHTLNNLHQMSVNMVKIDRSFVNTALADERSRMLFEYLLGIAKISSDITVAEGVESEEQRQFVLAQGVNLVQGYHLAAPLAAGELEPNMVPKPPEPASPERQAGEFAGFDHADSTTAEQISRDVESRWMASEAAAASIQNGSEAAEA